MEKALESLEKNSKQCPELTFEQKYWLNCESIDSMCCIPKDTVKILIDTANLNRFKKYVIQNKPLECVVEFILQKSLKECNLKEIVDGLMIAFKISHLFDTVDYKDNGDYYMLILTHSLGLNNSKLNIITLESVFKTYGVNIDSIVSEKTVFIKLFKINSYDS